MNIDLEQMAHPDLCALKNDIEAEIARRQNEEKAKAKKQIIELAKAYGLKVEDVLAKVAPGEHKTVSPKYRNPNDASQTWTGRGRKPAWVIQLIESGRSLEDCVI